MASKAGKQGTEGREMKRDLEKLKDALWCMHGLLFGLLLVATLHLSKIEKRLNDLLRQTSIMCEIACREVEP